MSNLEKWLLKLPYHKSLDPDSANYERLMDLAKRQNPMLVKQMSVFGGDAFCPHCSTIINPTYNLHNCGKCAQVLIWPQV